MTLVISGEAPSKKNSRINTRSGRSFPNKRYVAWNRDARIELFPQVAGKDIPFREPVELTVTFYHKDMVRRDSDNQLSSVLDTLVDVGILADDKWQAVPIKHVYDALDRQSPRCVISIEKIS
jgi:Holliday junction resolvase RusA-like endonuclease